MTGFVRVELQSVFIFFFVCYVLDFLNVCGCIFVALNHFCIALFIRLFVFFAKSGFGMSLSLSIQHTLLSQMRNANSHCPAELSAPRAHTNWHFILLPIDWPMYKVKYRSVNSTITI